MSLSEPTSHQQNMCRSTSGIQGTKVNSASPGLQVSEFEISVSRILSRHRCTCSYEPCAQCALTWAAGRGTPPSKTCDRLSRSLQKPVSGLLSSATWLFPTSHLLLTRVATSAYTSEERRRSTVDVQPSGRLGTMQAQDGINSYSQGDLQRMIRQVSDLYTQTAEATAKELEDASGLSEAGGENFKVSSLRVPSANSSVTSTL